MNLYCLNVLDSFLRNRSSSDHEATAMMKAQFMSLWDGLETDYNCQVQFRIFVRFTGLSVTQDPSQFPFLSDVLWLCFTKVIIMGATNRPQDLDSAILRRMPTRFHINQPVSSLILAQNMFDGLNNVQFYCWIIKLCSHSYKWSFVICMYLEY